WQEVAGLLRQPDRLLQLAAAYFSERADQKSVEGGQVADIDQRIANLEEAVGARAADALRAGLSHEMIRRAVAQLESELDALNRHRAELDAWAKQNAAQSERMASLARLAEAAHKRLDTMSDVERRAVLDLLDVRVTVLDSGDRRREPQIRIEGHVPELLSLDGNLNDAGLRHSS
ncbi:MAG: hypothetical protein JJE47_07540, partial [Acidimicrobiia bacterium]|nr:hypothetical protein [Acidimicrobiia bacterium]